MESLATRRREDKIVWIFASGPSLDDDRSRPLRVADALGNESTSSYTESPGGLTQSMATTTPDPDGFGPLSGFVTTTTLDPVTGVVLSTVDPNGRTTTGTYDALGRILTVRYPQHADITLPSVEYEYAVDDNGLNSVVTRTLNTDGTMQHASVALYDGLLRPFQNQFEGQNAGPDHDLAEASLGRLVSHIIRRPMSSGRAQMVSSASSRSTQARVEI